MVKGKEKGSGGAGGGGSRRRNTSARGGARGDASKTNEANEALNSMLPGKAYKDHVGELVKHTAMRVSDLDQKAVSLLDHLQTRGRAKLACDHLKQNLHGTSRDRIKNWRGYIYTLLRNFDEDAYSALKAEQAAAKAEQTTARRSKRGDHRGDGDDGKDGDEEDGDEGQTDGRAKNGEGSPGKSGAKKDGSMDKKPKELNQGAAEFVPGKVWPEAGSTGKRVKSPDFHSDAAEFVPGRPWAGVAVPGSPHHPHPSLTPNAPEFVPGQMTWMGAAAQAAAAAGAAARAGSGFQMGAAPFVPGRPWPPYAGYQASPKAAAAGQTPSKRRGGGAVASGGVPTPKAGAQGSKGAGAAAAGGGAQQQRARADGANGTGAKPVAAAGKVEPATRVSPESEAEAAPTADKDTAIQNTGKANQPGGTGGMSGTTWAVVAIAVAGLAALALVARRRKRLGS